MAGYDVTPGELLSAETQCAVAVEQGRADLVRLQTAAADLFEAGWSSPAGQGSAEGWRQWQVGAQAVLDALDAMGQALGRAARDYDAAEICSRVEVERVGG